MKRIDLSDPNVVKISDLINELQKFQDLHGDIPIATSASHEYWGNIDSILNKEQICVRNAQIYGPKHSEEEKCVVIEHI